MPEAALLPQRFDDPRRAPAPRHHPDHSAEKETEEDDRQPIGVTRDREHQGDEPEREKERRHRRADGPNKRGEEAERRTDHGE